MVELINPGRDLIQDDPSGRPRWLMTFEPFKMLVSMSLGLLERWQPGVLWVAEEAAALQTEFGPEHGKRAARILDMRRGDQLVVGRVSVAEGDSTHQVLNQFQSGSDRRKLNQCLAWILDQESEPKLALVCGNHSKGHRRFAMTALAELGRGRVAHPFDLWIDLFERCWITDAELGQLCNDTLDHDQGLSRLPRRVEKVIETTKESKDV